MTSIIALRSECDYWAFVEIHCAHIELAKTIHAEAMDLLRWCRKSMISIPIGISRLKLPFLDYVLPSGKIRNLPFSRQECQELMVLLESFIKLPSSNSMVQTQLLAGIFIRVGELYLIILAANNDDT